MIGVLAADPAAPCAVVDIPCWTRAAADDLIAKASNDALQQFVNNIFEGFGKALASLGTMWVRVPSPVTVIDGGGSSDGGGTPAGSAAFEQILGYVTWVGAGIAVVSLICAGVMMASRRRHGDGETHLGRVGVILIAVVLLSSASALVAGFLPQAMRGSNASSVVGWVQQHLQWYTAGLAILSILIAAARMAWTQRATPLKELMGSILTLIAVAGAGLVVIRLATVAGDEFSISVLNSALNCDVTDGGESSCFGTNVAGMIGLTTLSPIGLIGLFLMGVLAIIMTYAQVALMVFRGAMLVLLAGIFPIAASFTNTETGRQWFKKVLAWTIAFILYKPAAAIVYATAFKMTATDPFKTDKTGLFHIITGLALMLIALIALPALMRFLVPAVSSVSGGGGGAGLLLGAAALGGASEVATGAIRASNSGSSTGGASGGGGSSGGGPSGSGATAAGAKGSISAASGSGSAAATGSGSAATGAASSGAAAGGSAAAGGAAAGAAAAGPVGIGVAAAGKVASGAKQAAGAVQSQVADATGSNENGS